MMIKRLLVACLLALASVASAAQPPSFSPGAQANWKKLGFPGQARLIDTRFGLGNLIAVPAKCRPLISRVAQAVEAYGYLARTFTKDRDARIAQAQDGIQGLLSDRECGGGAASAYAVASLSLLSSKGWTRESGLGAALADRFAGTHKKIGPDYSLTPPNLYLSLLGAFLVNRGKLKVVNLSNWGDHELRGGYVCTHSQIFVEKRMSPFDIGAHFVAELEHLLRDFYPEGLYDEYDLSREANAKATQLESALGKRAADRFRARWKEQVETRILPLKRRYELLHDETISALQSSHREVSVSTAKDARGRRVGKLPSDLDLFSDGGPLASFWSPESLDLDDLLGYMKVLEKFGVIRGKDVFGLLQNIADGGLRNAPPESILLEEAFQAFLLENQMPSGSEAGDASLRKLLEANLRNVRAMKTSRLDPRVEEIYRRIHAIYFPGEEFSEDLKFFLDPRYHSLNIDPVFARQTAALLELIQRKGKDFHSDTQLPDLVISGPFTAGMTEIVLEHLSELAKKFDTVDSDSAGQTAACTTFLENARSGKLGTYIGVEPAAHPEGPGGIRPDGPGGIRPEGGGGIRPCLNLRHDL